MSVLSEVLRFGKDIVLLNERVERLIKEQSTTLAKLEDHERRLIRIETLIEFAATGRTSGRLEHKD